MSQPWNSMIIMRCQWVDLEIRWSLYQNTMFISDIRKLSTSKLTHGHVWGRRSWNFRTRFTRSYCWSLEIWFVLWDTNPRPTVPKSPPCLRTCFCTIAPCFLSRDYNFIVTVQSELTGPSHYSESEQTWQLEYRCISLSEHVLDYM